MAIHNARSVAVHWEEKRGQGVSEAIVEVQHDDGDIQFLTVQILRTSPKYRPEAVPQEFRKQEPERGARLENPDYNSGRIGGRTGRTEQG